MQNSHHDTRADHKSSYTRADHKAPIHAPTRSPTSTQCKAPNLKVFQLTSNITLEGSHSLLQSKQSRLRELSQRAIHGEISKDELLEIMDARRQVRETGIVSGTQWFADYIKTGKLNIPFCLGAKKYCDNDPLRAIYGRRREERRGMLRDSFRHYSAAYPRSNLVHGLE